MSRLSTRLTAGPRGEFLGVGEEAQGVGRGPIFEYSASGAA
jgi:hypothetical protein